MRGSFPGIGQFVVVHVDPGAHAQKLRAREIAFQYRSVFDQNGGAILSSVPHVDVGRGMVAILNFDEKSQKST